MTTPWSTDRTSNHFNSNSCGVSYDLIFSPSLQWVWDAGDKSQMEVGGVPPAHMKMYNVPSYFYGGWLIWQFHGMSSVFSFHLICLSPSKLRGWMCKVLIEIMKKQLEGFTINWPHWGAKVVLFISIVHNMPDYFPQKSEIYGQISRVEFIHVPGKWSFW